MAVTLKEIARQAGVSYQAVSAVLNNSSKVTVSAEKKERIMHLVEKLQYRPNLAARQLASKSNNVIGVIIDSEAPVFYRNVLQIIERLIFKHKLRLQVGLIHDDFESLKKYVDDFIGFGIKNVICLAHSYPYQDFPTQQAISLFDAFPNTVFMESPEGETKHPVVAADHYSVYREATEYLCRSNRKRIINCRVLYKDKAFYSSTQGFIDGYKSCGVPYKDEFMFYYPVQTIDSYEKAEHLLDQVAPLEPDALILYDDETTMWCYHVLKDRGIKVPEQISLVSGDLWKFGKAFNPTLAGIEYDYTNIAKCCVETVLSAMNSKANKQTGKNSLVQIRPRFHTGQSCCIKS